MIINLVGGGEVGGGGLNLMYWFGDEFLGEIDFFFFDDWIVFIFFFFRLRLM